MITENQRDYLSKLDSQKSERMIKVYPYNPRTSEIAEAIISGIKNTIPEAGVRFMGASALSISGQNDVDIYIICPSELRKTYSEKLNFVALTELGNKWKGPGDEIEISIYLSDPNDSKFKEQVEIFEKLKNNPTLLKEYENLKKANSGKTYKEYQTAKYEFYNRVLGISG